MTTTKDMIDKAMSLEGNSCDCFILAQKLGQGMDLLYAVLLTYDAPEEERTRKAAVAWLRENGVAVGGK